MIELPPGGVLLGLGCDIIEVARVRGVVERCDWYVVADPAVAARVKLELPPALAGRVVPA